MESVLSNGSLRSFIERIGRDSTESNEQTFFGAELYYMSIWSVGIEWSKSRPIIFPVVRPASPSLADEIVYWGIA